VLVVIGRFYDSIIHFHSKIRVQISTSEMLELDTISASLTSEEASGYFSAKLGIAERWRSSRISRRASTRGFEFLGGRQCREYYLNVGACCVLDSFSPFSLTLGTASLVMATSSEEALSLPLSVVLDTTSTFAPACSEAVTVARTEIPVEAP
jgi:hypothetical protein